MEIAKENKTIKKSRYQQLQTLVYFMEENPDLAKGSPMFGPGKLTAEEKWANICRQLNAIGPPSRTIAEWKKTWADLKSRTKKKIATNEKNLNETEGELYCYSNLTELEHVIDRILSLSSAAAASVTVYGAVDPLRDDSSDTVVSVSPSNREQIHHKECQQQQRYLPQYQQQFQQQHQSQRTNQQHLSKHHQDLPLQRQFIQQQHHSQKINQQRLPQQKELTPKCPQIERKSMKHKMESCSDSDSQQPSSSAKKRKPVAEQQLTLIRRQLKISGRSTIILEEQAKNIQRLADAAERSAIAAEATASSIKAIQETVENFLLNLKK